MTAAVAEELSQLAQRLPGTRISVADADRLAVSTDMWPRQLVRLHGGHMPILPAAVVWPESAAELCAIVRWAQEWGVSLVPYGAGSSVVGGAAAQSEHAVVVDIKRMDRVLSIDGEQRIATAEAGIVGELLERQLNRQGYTQGHFPSSIYCSTLGGWIAARSAGQMSSRYGKIEDQVLGGAVVTGDGRVVRLPPAPAHGAQLDALIGAEGALAIWTEATLRIHPLPEARVFRGLDFPSLEQALETAQAWLMQGLRPSVVRIYDPLDTLLHRSAHDAQRPHDRGPNWLAWIGAHLPRATATIGDLLGRSCRCVIAFEGARGTIESAMSEAVRMAGARGAADRGEAPGLQWYERRYAISYRQSNAFRAGVAVDTMEVACAWDRVAPVYRAVRAAALQAGAQIMAHFSHVYLEGCSIYFTYALPLAGGVEAYDRLWSDALHAALRAGANVSHHHGTGRLKRDALAEVAGATANAVARVRDVYDPQRVLNPDMLAPSSTPRTRRDGQRAVRRHPSPDSARGALVTAAPDRLLGALEERLAAEGMTLGPAGELLADWTVGEAARRGWLWRVSPLLQLTEPLVLGVDGFVDGQAHAAIVGPRAAMGPDVLEALLEAEPERLWLRCHPRGGEWLWYRGHLVACMTTARRIRQHPSLEGGEVLVRCDGHREAMLGLAAPAGHHAEQWSVSRLLEGLEAVEAPAPRLGPGDLATFISGPWGQLSELLVDRGTKASEVILPWTDPVGASGWILGEGTERVSAAVRRLGLDRLPSAVAEAAAAPITRDRPAGVRGDALGPGSAATVSLAGDAAALENCTWCPKLCRFSCPAAVADGSETLIPRQLMLTLALGRSERRALGPDVAERLYACVDCGTCRDYCDHDNDVAGVLRRARQELAVAGAQPERARLYLDHLARTGMPPDRPKGDHPALALASEQQSGPAETVLFLGCQGSATEPGPARSALLLAERLFGAVRVAEPGCCGAPLWRWGERDRFVEHARRVAGGLHGATRIVTDDPGCAWALRVGYPAVGVSLPAVFTTSQLLDSVAGMSFPDEPWTLHEACAARRHLRENALSPALAAASKTFRTGSVLEQTAGCCGGMMVESLDEELAQRMGLTAARDLSGAGAERILTLSPTCRRRLRRAGATVDDALSVWLGDREGDEAP